MLEVKDSFICYVMKKVLCFSLIAKNGPGFLKNLVSFSVKFLKYVWPF